MRPSALLLATCVLSAGCEQMQASVHGVLARAKQAVSEEQEEPQTQASPASAPSPEAPEQPPPATPAPPPAQALQSVEPAESPARASDDCLAGEFSTGSFGEVFSNLVRFQARGRTPTLVGDTKGALRLTLDPSAETVDVSFENAKAHYRSKLAGIVVSYWLGTKDGASGRLSVRGDRLALVVDPIDVHEIVKFDDAKREFRTSELRLEGEFRYVCSGDVLELHPANEDATFEPLRFERSRSRAPAS